MLGMTSRGSSTPARMLPVRRSRIALHRVEVLGERAYLSRVHLSTGEECGVKSNLALRELPLRADPQRGEKAGLGAGR